MKILITGASGFLGRKLVEELSKDSGNELTCISRDYKESLQNIYWINGNLNDRKFLDFLSNERFERVFHLAWEGLPNRSAEMCLKNLQISENFLRSISASKVQELNIIGSCLEYGDIVGKVGDSQKPFGNDPFAKAKINLHSFVQELEIQFRWFRPFFIFGEGQNQNSLIPSLINNLALGISPEIRSINNSHDFIAVEDVARAILLSSKNPHLLGDVNIGTGVLTPVGDIARALHAKFNVEFSSSYKSMPGLFSDSLKLKELTSWKPEFKGLDGIMKYVEEMGH